VKRRLILIILLMVFLCGCAKETIRPEEEVPETNELEEEKETESFQRGGHEHVYG
jgi:PBP1b-binding outer membrane lipoprotein LpoB